MPGTDSPLSKSPGDFSSYFRDSLWEVLFLDLRPLQTKVSLCPSTSKLPILSKDRNPELDGRKDHQPDDHGSSLPDLVLQRTRQVLVLLPALASGCTKRVQISLPERMGVGGRSAPG